MQTIKITKSDLSDDNFYKKEEIGKWDESEDVNVEIDENLRYVRFKKGIYVKGLIFAKAGSGIKAGEGIKAGSGIKAGLSITCKFLLKFSYRLFAGVAVWRDKDNEEKKITCGQLEGGTICYGDLEELGMPDDIKKDDTVEITVEGRIKKISRTSAKELNLI